MAIAADTSHTLSTANEFTNLRAAEESSSARWMGTTSTAAAAAAHVTGLVNCGMARVVSAQARLLTSAM
jgi:hypothetical protein